MLSFKTSKSTTHSANHEKLYLQKFEQLDEKKDPSKRITTI